MGLDGTVSMGRLGDVFSCFLFFCFFCFLRVLGEIGKILVDYGSFFFIGLFSYFT